MDRVHKQRRYTQYVRLTLLATQFTYIAMIPHEYRIPRNEKKKICGNSVRLETGARFQDRLHFPFKTQLASNTGRKQ